MKLHIFFYNINYVKHENLHNIILSYENKIEKTATTTLLVIVTATVKATTNHCKSDYIACRRRCSEIYRSKILNE